MSSLLACSASNSPRTWNLIDMTHPFDGKTIYWPTNRPFQWDKSSWGHTHEGYWYASATFSASEHGGTHIDAPIHFAKNGLTVDQIPPAHLMGEGVVLDIREKVASHPDYTLEVEDIRSWESKHGTIPSNSVVFLLTGWGEYWPDPRRYLGSDTPEDPHTLHFPSFSQASADFLLTHRDIRGIGIDTASIDPGQSKDFPVHRLLASRNRFGLENVANLDQLPPRGTWVMAFPMKIREGTGAPVRIVGILP